MNALLFFLYGWVQYHYFLSNFHEYSINLHELLGLLCSSNLYPSLQLLIELWHFNLLISWLLLAGINPLENGVSGQDGFTQEQRWTFIVGHLFYHCSSFLIKYHHLPWSIKITINFVKCRLERSTNANYIPSSTSLKPLLISPTLKL